MALEIERKFLVQGEFKTQAFEHIKIAQGYLSSVPERTVRIRIKGDKAFLTIKGIGNDSGATRYEWEKEISTTEAEELILLCEPGIIEKIRYLIKSGDHTFEVDEFHGDNEGLVIAEIELKSEEETFTRPPWLAEEVTGDSKYYNASLVKKPYNTWRKK